MPTKGERKRKDDNKTKNTKTSNPITLDVDEDKSKPVRGVPEV